ncbi:MAG: carboxymuconolactone decarboxylase family protein [Alphaproteobacteria bacterium]|jgi:AhpD family alkylhydroperoxidase|nr:carboxymuconolactone decarboxylase family protein [Alphaproteobacteria bacterium]HJP22787.1 carboxymuconolactone decarboxylase family protein [Alphaproteobacteria bacterium]
MSKDFAERAKEIDLNSRELFQAAPGPMGAYRDLMTKVSADGVLDGKTKELMALAISVAIRCEGCITYRARASSKKGASREEVAETITVAVEMGGGPAAVYGAEALAAFDQFDGG